MTAVPGRLRLTVLGCSTALPHPDAAGGGIPRRVRRDGHPPRCRSGCRQPPRSRRGPRELAGVVIGHMHADHFLDLAGLRYLFPWAGRGSSPAARPSAARRTQPARRARLGDLGTSGLLRRRLRHRRVRPGRDPHRRAADDPLRAGPPLRAGVGYLGRGARRRAPGLHRATPGRATRWSNSRAAPICCWSRRRLRDAARTTTSAAT